MTDMLEHIAEGMKQLPKLKDVVIKPYYRPESTPDNVASVVIVPVTPAQASAYGSNKPLKKQFTYQINVEAFTKAKSAEIANAIGEYLLEKGFMQINGGIDDYFRETKRYVDARRYRGYSPLYDTQY